MEIVQKMICENCCCLPCACTITKVPVDIERIFTTVKQSKGVKHCLQSHKRSEGVKWFLQSGSQCLASKIRKYSDAFVQDDCIDVQRDIRQNSIQGCGDKFYHAPHVRTSNSSKRSMKFNEDCGPSKRMWRASRNCVTKDSCGNCCSLPCECTIINVPSHVGKELSMMFGTINKQQNDKSQVKLGENSASCKWVILGENSESCQHKKCSHVDIQKMSADLQLSGSQHTTVKSGSVLPFDDHVKRLNSVKRSLQYDEHHGQSKIRKHSDFTLEEKNIDLIQTNLQHEESIFNIDSDTKYNEDNNSMYDKTKTFVNTVQRNCNVEIENVSHSNFISKNYGCICICCHGNTFQRCECVIFLQHNYNLLIPSVAKALSKRCKATKSKEFLCKKCHASLKMGKIPEIIINKSGERAHVCHNDVMWMEAEKHNVENVQMSMNLKQDPTITDWCLCTHCHVTDIP